MTRPPILPVGVRYATFGLPRYDGKENNIPNPMKDGGTMAELSSAAKEYLRVIYTLGQGAGVRSVDVATELGVSKPSVNKAIRILARGDWLCKNAMRRFF